MSLNYLVANGTLSIRLRDTHLAQLEENGMGLIAFIQGMKFVNRHRIGELSFAFPFTNLTGPVISTIASVIEFYSRALKKVTIKRTMNRDPYECKNVTKEAWFTLGEAIRSCTELKQFELRVRGNQAKYMDPFLRMLYGLPVDLEMGAANFMGLSGRHYRYADGPWTKHVEIMVLILNAKRHKPSFFLPVDLIRRLTEYLVGPMPWPINYWGHTA